MGAFLVTPGEAAVEAGEALFLEFTWTHTHRWRDLKTLQLRIVDDGQPTLWVLWDQESNAFSLVDEQGEPSGHTALPGSHGKLKGKHATLHLDETSVLTSGPDGHDVTLTLALSFEKKAAGHDHRDYVVEVSATDDFGNEQGFDRAGTLRVER